MCMSWMTLYNVLFCGFLQGKYANRKDQHDFFLRKYCLLTGVKAAVVWAVSANHKTFWKSNIQIVDKYTVSLAPANKTV